MSRDTIASGRPGYLVEKLKNRNPEPILFEQSDVQGIGDTITIKVQEGFAADISVAVRRSSQAARFSIVDATQNEVDYAYILGNSSGIMRFINQQSELPFSFAVVSDNPSAEYDYAVTVLQHRITGVI